MIEFRLCQKNSIFFPIINNIATFGRHFQVCGIHNPDDYNTTSLLTIKLKFL